MSLRWSSILSVMTLVAITNVAQYTYLWRISSKSENHLLKPSLEALRAELESLVDHKIKKHLAASHANSKLSSPSVPLEQIGYNPPKSLKSMNARATSDPERALQANPAHNLRYRELEDWAFSYDQNFERKRLFEKQRFLGVRYGQDPVDTLAIQEIIVDVRPDLIIETGDKYNRPL